MWAKIGAASSAPTTQTGTIGARARMAASTKLPRLLMLLADRLADHRGVGRERAGVVRDEQRAAGRGHVLDALDVAAEPVAVEELEQPAVVDPLDPLRPPPVVE